MTLPFDFDILSTLLVADEGVDVDVAERHFLHEVQAHHHHPGDPEEDDVEAGDEGARRVVAPQLRRLVGPAERRERPQGRREPGVEHVLVAHEVTCGALRILGEGGRLVLAQRALHDGVGERLGERLLLASRRRRRRRPARTRPGSDDPTRAGARRTTARCSRATGNRSSPRSPGTKRVCPARTASSARSASGLTFTYHWSVR